MACDKGFMWFKEPITKMEIKETISKDGCKIERLILNDTWVLTPTDDASKPFKVTRKPNKKTNN